MLGQLSTGTKNDGEIRKYLHYNIVTQEIKKTILKYT